MTHALIIGGGIAGAATALALGKAGVTSTVYEAYPTGGDDVGAWLMVMHNGMDALRAIDADKPVIEASFRTRDVEYIGADGKTFASGPMGAAHPDPDGPRTIKRADLYLALQGELERRGGKIEHGKRLVSAEITDRVVATFEDGGTAKGDFLVGADGVWSTTRGLIDLDAPKPEFSGVTLVYGYTRDPSVPTVQDTCRLITGGVVCTTSPENETFWAAVVPGPPDDRPWLEVLAAQVAGTDIPRRVITAEQDDVLATGIHHLPHALPRWHNSRMVLVGDAAHLSATSAAQGASIALEDSVILAMCVRDVPDLERAFAAYQRIRAPRAQRLAEMVAKPVRTPEEARENARPEVRAWLYEHEIHWNEVIVP
ncbi:FAD-dependent oxidoreductase [Kutzneria kofuensis]|uniref:2-polyprenyl-6-methoxyphenol hydroxylase-like FAD-dependent oxidoreductase n=1 Tax=Kutzneria kofuensis TaxID=103725 RepID=A0A7W9KG98_9PSEU|nr:FAD-dependent monooxygenase [Kutzneria kofuensis]MBB5891274.1 2-polyprenyl-6-methoxyphenol hydroxylase-like FAD-dependent oxidoreductase [Kutzneria kofuensis]